MKKIFCLIIVVLTITGCTDESYKRAEKDSESARNGLNRALTAYSNDGKVLATYSGKFDIESNGNKVKFDLAGKRIIIYNAIVITKERQE